MRVETDKRSRRVEPAPEAKRAARAAFRAIAAAETRAAKALATIERKRAYVPDGFRSVHAWAKAVGYGPQQTRRLLELGRTLLDEPDLDDKVARGEVPAETAAQVGRVLREGKLDLNAEERKGWKDRAAGEDPDKVRDQAEQAVEDARQGAPTFSLRFRVTKKIRDGYRRIRQLMAQGVRGLPTDGEIFGRMVEDYLVRHDPKERPLPKRRKARSSKRTRAVPRQVQAIVRRRSGGTCEICRTRPARELIHLVPFSEGGTNEADNIGHGCWDCHVFFDAGVFRFSCFDDAGLPVFVFDHDRFESLRARDDVAGGRNGNRGGNGAGQSGDSVGKGRNRGGRSWGRDGASSVRERSPPCYGSSRQHRTPAAMAPGPP